MLPRVCVSVSVCVCDDNGGMCVVFPYVCVGERKTCRALVLKCVLGDRITSGQLRHVAVYSCIYHVSPRCPADHLC